MHVFGSQEFYHLTHCNCAKITYDKNIQINPDAQAPSDQYPLITRDSNGKNLKLYFNTASWSPTFKAEYDRLASMARKDRFLQSVEFSVDTVEYSGENPLGEDARVLTLTSPKLYQYLKEINVKSNSIMDRDFLLQRQE